MINILRAWLTRRRQDRSIVGLLQDLTSTETMEKSRNAWFDFPIPARVLSVYSMTVQPLVIVALLVLVFLLVPTGGIDGLAASIKESTTPVSAQPKGSAEGIAVVFWLIAGSLVLAMFALAIHGEGWKGILTGGKVLGAILLFFTAVVLWNFLVPSFSAIVNMGVALIAETLIFSYVFAYLSELVVTYSGRTSAKDYCNYLGLLFLFTFGVLGWFGLVIGPLQDAIPRLLHWSSIVLGAFIAPMLIPRVRASIAHDIGGEENT